MTPFLGRYFWWATPGYLAPLKIGTPPINGGGGGFGSFISRAFPDGDGAVLDIGVVGVVTVTAPWYTRGVLGAIGDWSRGFANSITMGLVDYVDRRWHKVPEEEFERLRNSTAHNVGEWTGTAVGLAIPGGAGVKVGLKAASWSGKLALHGAHHPFKILGGRKLAHIQMNVWKKGVRNSGKTLFRIPLPSTKNFKEKIIFKWGK